MQRAYQTDKDMFQWLQSIGYGEHFNHHMGAYGYGRLPWMDPAVYPVQERLIEGADTSADAPFLVDIAGSIGHDLEKFRGYFPDHPGRLVLEDLPGVIGQIKALHPGIARVAYDFHTPQPVVGARAYYMHSVLHDWPDAVCGSILGRVARAMRPGYSRLLINENVLPRTRAPWEMTALDMMMLTLFSSQERAEDDWRALLAANGLRVVGIWRGQKAWESLIECELATGAPEGSAEAESAAESPVSTVNSTFDADSVADSTHGDGVERAEEAKVESVAQKKDVSMAEPTAGPTTEIAIEE